MPPALPSSTTTLLCDADGTLFPSEEPAFAASVPVVNDCLRRWGSSTTFTADELRRRANGLSFRRSLTALAQQHRVATDAEPFLSDLERVVAEENALVTTRLAEVLQVDETVRAPLTRLAGRFGLALVSSSALSRLGPCLASTGLVGLFPDEVRFSAQDSLAVPTSKPDPAIYSFAAAALGLRPDQAVAVEDAVPGAQSAVAAGIPTVGMLCFVPADEVDQRSAELREVGVSALVGSWSELEHLLHRPGAGVLV